MGKFTFDGVTKKIHMNAETDVAGTYTFSIAELWTEWCDWLVIGDNLKYAPALTSLMTPLTATEFVGPYLFIRNDLGWVGVPPNVDTCTIIVEGSFFGQDPLLPIMQNNPTQTTNLIINRSSLTNTTSVSGGGSVYSLEQMADAIWTRAQRTLTTGSTVTAQEVWEYGNRSLTVATGGGLNEEELHLALDSYTNKDDWKATETAVDLTQITAELADIQVKLGQLSNYDDAELITLITGLETLTQDERAKLMSLENYNDTTLVGLINSLETLKSDERAKLLSLVNYDDNSLTAMVQSLETLTIDERAKLFSLSNYNDAVLVNMVENLETLKVDERAKLLSLENYNDAAVLARVNNLPALVDIENSSVLAKKSDISLVEQIVNTLPVMSDIRDELVNIVHGSLEISNNQMIVKDKDGIILSIFGLKDKNGNPTMTNVFKRDVVQ